MSYPKKIVKVRPLGGIANDLPPFEVSPQFYTAGRNVHFRSGFAERTKGHAQVYALNSGIQGDGTNHLDAGDIAAFDRGTGDFSIEFWAKHSGVDTTLMLVSKRASDTATGYEIAQRIGFEIRVTLDDGTVDLDITTGGDAFPDDGNLHHIAVSVARGGVRLCKIRVDGVEEASGNLATLTDPMDNTASFTVFGRGAALPFDGIIDELRFWDDVRTLAEFDDNKSKELATEASLIGYWTMKGVIGASVTTVTDDSGNGSTLTDTGAGDLTYVDTVSAFKNGALSTLRNLSNCQVAGVNYWLYHGTDKSSVVTGATHTDITKAGGITGTTVANKITSGLLNGVHFMNNGIDAPMFWDGVVSNPMTDLTGWPAATTCKAMRAFKFHLFAMDISKPAGEFPMQVLWSDAAAPGTIPASWTAAATNEAGDAELSQTPGPIIDGAGLGASFALYKQHSMYAADYVGGNNIFKFRKLSVTAGVLSRNCIGTYKGRHFVVTDGDVILTDGARQESIIDNKNRKFLFNQLDQDNYEATFIAELLQENEIWVCFPSAGNTFCDLALIWDGAANAWGVRELPSITHAASGIVSDLTVSEFWDDDNEVWDLDTTTWNEQNFSNADDRLVMAQPSDSTPANSKLLEVDSGSTFDGTNIEAVISKYSMPFDEPNRVKFVRRVVPHIQANPGTVILARAGSQMASADPISWSNEVTYTVGTDKWIDTFAQGKFLSFEFRSEGVPHWLMSGFDVEAEQRGYY